MTLSRWWLWLFPLLYLPNLGFASTTAFGTLEVSDFLIGPYIMLVLLAVRPDRTARNYCQVWPWLLAFVAVAFVSTVTILWRYPNTSSYPVTFGLLKLGKLSLYGLAGVLTARALSRDTHRFHYDWALLAGDVVMAISLFSIPEKASQSSYSATPLGYKANNAISTMMAVLLVYLLAKVILRTNSKTWQRLATWLLPFIGIGFFLSEGRGGWVAALAGAMFLLYKVGLRRQVVLACLIGVVTVCLAYSEYPSFSKQVDQTLWPDQAYLDRYNAGVAGLDDGARITTWINEASKLPRAAVLGTGFFHRGPASGLWSTGSHNFWLQILLETGIVGFGLLCGIGWKIWGQTGTRMAVNAGLSIPARSALIAVLVGGLSGEYFYGGMVLFTVFAVYAPVGSMLYNQGSKGREVGKKGEQLDSLNYYSGL